MGTMGVVAREVAVGAQAMMMITTRLMWSARILHLLWRLSALRMHARMEELEVSEVVFR